MQQERTVESQISDYFAVADSLLTSEKAVINDARLEVSARKGFVTNKDLIGCLLEKLETETDVVQLDIYRNALELIVQRTPDDLA